MRRRMRPAIASLLVLLAAATWTVEVRAQAASESPAAAAATAPDGSADATAAEPGASADDAAAVLPDAASAPPAIPVVVEQPRAFGHVLGDLLTQRVKLMHAGRALRPATLPAADRVGLYLERRAPREHEDEHGQRWLSIDYQVVNAPRALTTLALPALSIPTDGGLLQVPAWPIGVGPIAPSAAVDAGQLPALRPDRPVEPVPTIALERQLRATLAVLAAVLLAWAGWWGWRNARESGRLPFAGAWRRLRRMDPGDAQAWRELHHALNATAGRVVHGRSLPRLLAEAPQLRPLAPQLEAFFRHSEQRFFATAAGLPTEAPGLHELARALRDVERRHQR